jgi:4'-phosphopantetheinyl transferase
MRLPAPGLPRDARLRSGEVHVWILDTRFDGARSASAELLSPGERDRAARYRFRRDGERFERHRAALRAVLGRYLDAAPADLAFDTACPHCGSLTHGKPEVHGAPPGFSFNRSGAGEVAAIAVAQGLRVGVDIECQRRVAGGETAGLRAWTRKEAVLKVDGHGLAIDPDSLEISSRPDSLEVSSRPGSPRPRVSRAPAEHPELLGFQLSDLPIAGAWGCGCVATDLPAQRLEFFAAEATSLLGADGPPAASIAAAKNLHFRDTRATPCLQ